MISVRPATLDDSERIADIHVKTWQAAYAGVMPQDFLDRLDRGARTAMWRRAIGRRYAAGWHLRGRDRWRGGRIRRGRPLSTAGG